MGNVRHIRRVLTEALTLTVTVATTFLHFQKIGKPAAELRIQMEAGNFNSGEFRFRKFSSKLL